MPGHTDAMPEIVPGCAGILPDIDIASDLIVLLPQLLLAVTVIDPPDVPDIADIEFVADVPDQPGGSVQV